MNKDRLHIFDYCKGLAIIFVVIGHYLPEQSPYTWKFLNTLLYTFHMPIFFFVSGFFFYNDLQKNISLTSIIQKKYTRLLFPYIIISAIFVAVKLFAGLFVNLDKSVSYEGIINVFIKPLESFIPLLWFMQALFIIFVLFTFLNRIVKVNTSMLLLIAIVFSGTVDTKILSLSGVFYHFPFFCYGVLFNSHLKDHSKTKYFLFLSVLVFFACSVLFLKISGNSLLIKMLLAFTGINSTVAISKLMADRGYCKWIETVGCCSMGIYLLHTFFESFIRIAYYQILKIPNSFFWVGASVAISAGIFLPALIETFFLRRFAITRHYILGIK